MAAPAITAQGRDTRNRSTTTARVERSITRDGRLETIAAKALPIGVAGLACATAAAASACRASSALKTLAADCRTAGGGVVRTAATRTASSASRAARTSSPTALGGQTTEARISTFGCSATSTTHDHLGCSRCETEFTLAHAATAAATSLIARTGGIATTPPTRHDQVLNLQARKRQRGTACTKHDVIGQGGACG